VSYEFPAMIARAGIVFIMYVCLSACVLLCMYVNKLKSGSGDTSNGVDQHIG